MKNISRASSSTALFLRQQKFKIFNGSTSPAALIAMPRTRGLMTSSANPQKFKFNFPIVPRRFNSTNTAANANQVNTADFMPKETTVDYSVDLIRNIGIIAHVDHGKTTLVDCLLRQSGCMEEAENNANDMIRVMDSNDLEKERGITILSKCTSITWNKYHINVVDTPGHADFGGEVERILNMVDGVVLLVDASSGPQAQTKFVLSKAFKQGLRVIVVQNKVDRETARCEEVDNEILELFMALEASDEQLMYPTIYASAKHGWALKENPMKTKINLGELKPNMNVLFDAIVNYLKPPVVDLDAPFTFLSNNLEQNLFLGRCQMGRIAAGRVAIGDPLIALSEAGEKVATGKVMKIFIRRGLEKFSIPKAAAGDIVILAGIPDAGVNTTICEPNVKVPLPTVPIDPPTLSVYFAVNDSPLAGKEGKVLTFSSLQDRLRKETEVNLALLFGEIIDGKYIEVQGRGELQLGILIETMRREGFEFAVSPPQVMFKPDPENPEKLLEPIEELVIDVNPEHSGVIIEKLNLRKCILQTMDEEGGKTRLIFHGPTRSLIGYNSEFKNDTHGTGIISQSVVRYDPHLGILDGYRRGALISCATGNMQSHSMISMEKRGKFFYPAGTPTYPGMVVGECLRDEDLEINISKAKAITSVRCEFKEQTVNAKAAESMRLEEMLSYMRGDEILEVTPQSLRLRKVILNLADRRAQLRKMKKGL